MLAGVNERILEQLEKTELLTLLGKQDVVPADPRYFGPLETALGRARSWIATGASEVEPGKTRRALE